MDGDDKADVRKCFSPDGAPGTHLGSRSALRFDNWIWGVVGCSGFRGAVGGKGFASGGVYRFKPDGSQLEDLSVRAITTRGLGFSEDAIVFVARRQRQRACSCHSNRYYKPSMAGRPAVWAIADSQRFIRSPTRSGKLTSMVVTPLARAVRLHRRNFPKEY